MASSNTPQAGGETGARGRGRAGAHLGRFIASRKRSALGVPETIALAASAVLLAAAISAYFFHLRPQRARLENLKAEQSRLERQLQSARSEGQQSESTQASVDKILASLQDFEAQYLGANTPQSTTQVADELNDLIRRHSLRISGGLAYTQFEVQREGAGQSQRERPASGGVSKPIQNVFPGMGISMAIEGPYANLRRFIRDVESDPRFIVINSIELEGIMDAGSRAALPPSSAPSDVPGEGAAAAPGAPQTPTARGTLVSLRLDMAAYFRRAGVPSAASEQTSTGAAAPTR